MVTTMNGYPLVVLPSSSMRRRGEAAAARRMYSTMRSQRSNFLSVPMRNPANCSGVGRVAPGSAETNSNTAEASESLRVMGTIIGHAATGPGGLAVSCSNGDDDCRHLHFVFRG